MTNHALPADSPSLLHEFAEVNGIRIHYALAGQGPALLLLHGWPFTWYTWRLMLPALARHYTVIMPDLRGIGQTSRPADGYDSRTRAADAAGLVRHLGFAQADVLGHDLGLEVAFTTALNYPQLVRRLVLTNAIVRGLPGAESFLQPGPWWFSFHAVPDLPERVVSDHEAEYLGWFFRNSSFQHRGLGPAAEAEYVAAYTGTEALRGGFAHYRAFPHNQAEVTEALAQGRRLTQPVLTVCSGVLADVLPRQLGHIADDVTSHRVADCGHAVQEEQPAEFARVLLDFLARS